MLDVNSLDLGDAIVLDEDSISNATGKVYLKGTEVEVVGFTKKDSSSRPAKALVLDITLRYPDGEQALVSGVADILILVARRFHKKTVGNINLKIGDVFKVEETLLIRHCGISVWVDAVEVKVTGLKRGNCNFEITDVDGTVWLYSKHLSKFINEIAVKNVKLLNEEKQEVKRIDIYSDRETLQLGDVVLTTGKGTINGTKVHKGVYGRVVSFNEENGHSVIHFEGDYAEKYKNLSQLLANDAIIEDGVLHIVNHRNVPDDFVPHKEVQEVEYVKTGDFMGVIGKKYFIQGGTGHIEVICIEEDENPMCIDAGTFGYIGDMRFNELYEKKTVTKRIPIAPTASVSLK